MGASGSAPTPYTIRENVPAPHYEAAQNILAQVKALLEDPEHGSLIPTSGKEQLLNDYYASVPASLPIKVSLC
jgi:hypothetical protein